MMMADIKKDVSRETQVDFVGNIPAQDPVDVAASAVKKFIAGRITRKEMRDALSKCSDDELEFVSIATRLSVSKLQMLRLFPPMAT